MDETTFADPSVLQHLEDSYISVKINIDDFDGYAIKEQYNVRVLPTILIFNHDGKIVERIEETLSPSNMIVVLQNNRKNLLEKLHSPNIAPKKVNYNIANGSNDTDENLTNAARNSYKLQLGVFNSYENTLKFYKKLKGEISTKTIIVLNDFIGDRVVYRVLLGNFSNTSEAEIFKTDLSNNLGIESNLFF
jgi:thioredoxin-related protein